MENKDDLIFALDIGTRTVVGAILEPKCNKLTLKASQVIEHQKRSMLDGQIHNVTEVVEQVKRIKRNLEEKCNTTLEKVGIAAAGRALKTVTGHYEIEFKNKKEITAEDVKMVEFAAVQDAQQKLASGKDRNKASGYHFVGYTLLQSMLDGIKVGNLIRQSGKKIEIDLIATFLPRIVVDSLLTVIRQSELQVDHLTLEPIAAANLIVPQQMYNFNLALVDIGAGTSDIAITREGSIIGYDMVPIAGDEITEAICENYMVDYHTAENIKRKLMEVEEIEIKDILDQKIKISTTSIIQKIEDKVEKLAKSISESILELNSNQPQAVICIGGGSLTPLLKEKLAKELDLPPNRVGIKDGEGLKEIEGKINNLTGTQSITPLGIALSCKKNKNRANFIDIEVNGDLIHLFTLTEPKVSDALLAAEIDIKALKANPGLALSVEVNGNLKMIKGTMGISGKVLVNGQEADINTKINNGDQLKIKIGEKGRAGEGVINDVVPDLPVRKIIVNGTEVKLKPIYYMNDKRASADTQLEDRAKITYEIPQTVGDIIEEVLEFSLDNLKKKKIKYFLNGEEKVEEYKNYKILINNKEVGIETEVNEGDELIFKENEVNALKIGHILTEETKQQELNIIFNDRNLKVPAKDYKLLKNGDPATLNDFIYTGDEIEYKKGGIRLNQLLNYIDYQIPMALEGKLIIEKNEQKAQLIEPLADGDKVKIYIDKG